MAGLPGPVTWSLTVVDSAEVNICVSRDGTKPVQSALHYKCLNAHSLSQYFANFKCSVENVSKYSTAACDFKFVLP